MFSVSKQRRLVSIVVGLAMVGLGLLFLVDQLVAVSLWRYSWPFFVIIPGLLCFLAMALGGRDAGWLAVPGSTVTAIGLLLLYQNASSHWESWAYAWALVFPGAYGVGLAIQGIWSGRARRAAAGWRWARVGVVIFLVGGVFFESVLGISHSPLGRLAWPLLLIGVGAYLLLRVGGPGPQEQPPVVAGGRLGESEPSPAGVVPQPDALDDEEDEM